MRGNGMLMRETRSGMIYYRRTSNVILFGASGKHFMARKIKI
jgi:hypothetical protein